MLDGIFIISFFFRFKPPTCTAVIRNLHAYFLVFAYTVGKHVMEMASKNLIPVTLELGGETGNWCIIRKDVMEMIHTFPAEVLQIVWFLIIRIGILNI